MKTDRSNRRPRRIITLAIALLFMPLLAAAQETAGRWFHVHVTEAEDGAEVRVNLPLAFIEKALDLMPQEVSEEVRVELNEAGFDIDELRDLWQELRTSPDATFVTVDGVEETVQVRKEGDFLVARTTESSADGARVDVRFPLDVVDALFSGEAETLDLAAAVRALAAYDGDMVTVEDRETRVRVWIDGRNEGE